MPTQQWNSGEIPILDVTPLGNYENGLPYYDFGCTYQVIALCEAAYHTKEAAYMDAIEWCSKFEADGNLACALGVTERNNKFFGVVNYSKL